MSDLAADLADVTAATPVPDNVVQMQPQEVAEHVRRLVEAAQRPALLPPHVQACWDRVRPQLAEAMANSLHSIDALETDLITGRYQLWPSPNGALITTIENYSSGKRALQTMWAVGDIDEIVAMAPGVEAWARLQGCTQMIVEGRKAWTRLLADRGYRPFSVTLTKDL